MANEHAVAETLRRRMLTDIGSGTLPPGARLGSERELSEHYGVSRATLRQVLAALEEAGLVRRVAGRGGGTFINHAKVEHDLTKVVGVPAYLARQGYSAGTRVVATKMGVADAPTRRALQLGEGDLVVDVRRLRLADGTPFSLDHARLPADRFPGLLEQPLGGSIYELIENDYGIAIADAEEVVEVVHATDEEAALLGIAVGDPLVSITRTTYDTTGTPFEFSHDLFRSDRVRITLRTPGRGLRGIPGGDTPHFATISSVPAG
ncbi:GntR family transcriptional regulator [Nocardioides carbamazepini]|uniref:GntR family transcriptional regulator n=1 Tax=Nocardioides carbamazepini TaxID=2854259 RepID=UPI00214A58E6|nr:GntR family transcriptional regulator [Nocardioides carbamazepini]MCR1786203.1 GntR family transcriptional regulator [Nocardioides carbamazepini]